MKRIKKGIIGEEGQTLVEFALVLPVLLMLVLGIAEFGWVFFARISATNGAREGARALAVKYDLPFAATSANNAMQGLNFLSSTKPVVQASTIPKSHANPIPKAVVIIDGKIDALIGLYLPQQVPIYAKAVMRVEYD